MFNTSSSEVIVGTGAPKNPTGRFRLLPGCESNVDADITWVAARDPSTLLNGKNAWRINKAVAHIIDSPSGARLACIDCSPLASRPPGIDEPSALERVGTLPRKPWVTVLGAGVAGLTAAHELIERGFRVQVIEKSHGTPTRREGNETDPPHVRLGRGLLEPDIGGVARTQWTTPPLTRRGGLGKGVGPTNSSGPEPSPLRLKSVHGDGDWYGHPSPPPSGSPPTYDIPFTIPFIGAKLANDGVPLEKSIERWLRTINDSEAAGSIAALQIVVVVLRPRSPDANDRRFGPQAAFERLRTFLAWLAKNAPLKAILENIETMPVARIEVDDQLPASGQRFSGLLLRHHNSVGLIAGEHGFRFFPGFYRHLRDTMRRTPIFDAEEHRFTERTTHDNLTEVRWQVIDDPTRKHRGAYLRESFSTVGQMAKQYTRFREDLGYRPSDTLRFMLRQLRYMTSSSKRRATYYEDLSWWDFLSLRRLEDAGKPDAKRLVYGERFERVMRHAPAALVAMSPEVSDARTLGNISVQLLMDTFDLHDATDSTLSGPTSESWLRHWREYLAQQGVRFHVGEVTSITQGNDGKAAVEIAFPRGTPDLYFDPARDLVGEAHYYVSALDAVALARVTRGLKADKTRDYDVFGRVADLVPQGLERSVLTAKRDEPFQTFSGVQLYYVERVSFQKAHIYYPESPWGLSAISQVQYWGPSGVGLGHAHLLGNLSLDIGSWRAEGDAPDPNVLTPTAIAAQVGEQIKRSTQRASSGPAPTYFHVDDFIQFSGTAGFLETAPIRPTWNRAPFLINTVGGWEKRPAGDPWSAVDRSLRDRRPGDGRYVNAQGEPKVWMHRAGGYGVYFDSLVVAGTHMRTFTRMTTMESANESARLAVNALLDFMTFKVKSKEAEPEKLGRPELYDPSRVATPFGDYCEVWNLEDNELDDLDFLRLIDKHLVEACTNDLGEQDDAPAGQSKRTPPHLFDLLQIDSIPDFIDNDIDGTKVFDLLGDALDKLRRETSKEAGSVLGLVDALRKQFELLVRKSVTM
ncbi:MAG: NAD(P)-binding protein [Labilithrix sp.]|nr:NAD(P)-binding protein [Labilithrix sp.]